MGRCCCCIYLRQKNLLICLKKKKQLIALGKYNILQCRGVSEKKMKKKKDTNTWLLKLTSVSLYIHGTPLPSGPRISQVFVKLSLHTEYGKKYGNNEGRKTNTVLWIRVQRMYEGIWDIHVHVYGFACKSPTSFVIKTMYTHNLFLNSKFYFLNLRKKVNSSLHALNLYKKNNYLHFQMITLSNEINQNFLFLI